MKKPERNQFVMTLKKLDAQNLDFGSIWPLSKRRGRMITYFNETS
jgi:hypothetical protein